ncbi:tetratricopeptide repeat protein [Novipirellula maiorica]|nr:hypothetical protein [Rhodopirellula maiorica]
MVWGSYFAPEVDRARDTLRQVEDPFTVLPNHNSRVNQWRLFFPIIGYVFNLGDRPFLTLPFLGCLVTLSYIAALFRKHPFSLPETLLATMLMAMLPWYFVSTGWLAYFDSWLVLGLLVAAFSRNRWALLAACLVTPWIDERFVLGFPIVLLVRVALVDKASGLTKQQRSELLWMIGATLVYPVIRALALLSGNDPVTQPYASEHTSSVFAVPVSTFVAGLWQGYRVMWLFVGVFIAFAYRRFGGLAFAFACFLVVGTAFGSLVIAGDMHRSLQMLLPALVVGVIHAKVIWQRAFVGALAAAVVMMVLLPASHRLWFENYPIGRLSQELLREPPDDEELMNRGIARASQLLSEGDTRGAVMIADDLVDRLEFPVTGLLFRADLHADLGELADAEADVRRAIELAPNSPHCHFAYGVLLIEMEKRGEALDEFKKAAELGGPQWSGYADSTAAIRMLSR